MKRERESRRIALIGAAVCVGVLIWSAFYSTSTGWRKSAPVRHYQDLTRIGNGLRRYVEEHGNRLPERLSELVPTYVAYTNVGWFFSGKSPLLSSNGPAEASLLARRVDEEGAFVYLGERGREHDIIAYERAGLPLDGGSKGTVVVLAGDFTSKLRSVAEVDRAIGRREGVR